jgi:uncharacterized membrane protein YagU involved in acid resistance
MMGYLKRLVQSDTKDSSKRFALIVGVFIAALWMLLYLPAMLFIDQIWGKPLASDLFGIAAVVAAVEAILAILILAKVKSEKYEREKPKNYD